MISYIIKVSKVVKYFGNNPNNLLFLLVRIFTKFFIFAR